MAHKMVELNLSAERCIEEARGEVQMLAEEMRDWADRMEESDGLAATAKHDEVAEAADALENAVETLDNIPDEKTLLKLAVLLHFCEPRVYGKRQTPRWMRLEQATARLNAVIDAIDEHKNDLNDLDNTDVSDALDDIKSELESAVDELQNVTFPGMY